jgi:hypothetical protein
MGVRGLAAGRAHRLRRAAFGGRGCDTGRDRRGAGFQPQDQGSGFGAGALTQPLNDGGQRGQVTQAHQGDIAPAAGGVIGEA